MEKLNFAKDLISFIDQSPTMYQAVDQMEKLLLEHDYIKLNQKDSWKLKPHTGYFITNNDSAIIAFYTGDSNIEKYGFHIVGSHSDSPGFRVKPNATMKNDGFWKLNTEVYGGPILSTWFDRPLSLAGRVVVKSKNSFNPEVKLLTIDRDLLIIPNLAIHMNREVNEGYSFNRQKDVLPILSLINDDLEEENLLVREIGKELSVDPEDILDFDLYLYDRQKGSILGVNNEFISIGRLDNLAMAHASIHALLSSKKNQATNICIVTDNEEVGSMSRQGANSPMIINLLERIILGFGKTREDYHRAVANSYMISSDMAHAAHPNYPEKADPTNRPKINHGPTIKLAANKAYTSDALSSGIFIQLCDQANVPYQFFTNRSDMRGGSTIGPITSSHLDICAIDIGNPTLAMHSVRELAGVDDHFYIYKVFQQLYR